MVKHLEEGDDKSEDDNDRDDDIHNDDRLERDVRSRLVHVSDDSANR